MTTKTYDKFDVDKLPDLNEKRSFSVDDLPDLKKKDGLDVSGKESAPLQSQFGDVNQIKAFLTGKSVQEIEADKRRNMKIPTKRVMTQVKKVNDYKDESVKDAAEQKINQLSDDDIADPILGVNKLSQANPTNPKDILATEKAKATLINRIAPDGYDAKQMLNLTHFGADENNQTSQILKQKADDYDKSVAPLRNIQVGDLKEATPEYLDNATTPQLKNAAIQYGAQKDPEFAKELQVMGIDLNDPDLAGKVGSFKSGQWTDRMLRDDNVMTFLQKENPNLLKAAERTSKQIRVDNPEYGVNAVANEVSKAIEESRYNHIEPIANYFGDNSKEFADQVAKELYKNDPQSMKIYEQYIQPHKENFLDLPSVAEKFARGGESIGKGVIKSYTKNFSPASEAIRNSWDKEAQNVSADRKGIWKIIDGASETAGVVSGIIATANVLGPFAGPLASDIAVGSAFWGDALEQGKVKFPDSPVKATFSALANTAMYVAMGKSIFPADKVKSALSRVQPELNQVVENLASGAITKEAARREIQSVAKQAWDFASGTLTKNAKVTGELMFIPKVDAVVDKIMGMNESGMKKYHDDSQDSENTAHYFLSNLVINGLSKYGEMKRGNKMVEESLWNAVTNPKQTERGIDMASIDKSFGTVEEIKDNFRFLKGVKDEMDALHIAPKDQKRFLFETLRERVAKGELERTEDSTLRKRNEEVVAEAQDVKEKIISGEPLSEEQKPPPTEEEKAQDILGKAKLDDINRSMADADPVGMLKYIAQQAQNLNEQFEPHGDGKEAASLKRAQDSFGEDTVKEAIALYPKKESQAAITTEGAAENVVPSTLEKAVKIDKEKTYYRGVNDSQKGEFYSEDKEVADNYSIKKVGDTPNIQEVKGDKLTGNFYDATNKEDLADELGIKTASVYDFDFDSKVQQELQKQGYDGVKYSEGTFDAEEIHVFQKQQTNTNRAGDVVPSTLKPTGKEADYLGTEHAIATINKGAFYPKEEKISEKKNAVLERDDNGKLDVYHLEQYNTESGLKRFVLIKDGKEKPIAGIIVNGKNEIIQARSDKKGLGSKLGELVKKEIPNLSASGDVSNQGLKFLEKLGIPTNIEQQTKPIEQVNEKGVINEESRVPRLGDNETTMSESEKQKVRILREERDNRLREVEKELRSISSRYGEKTKPESFNREDRQRWELLQRELQMGYKERADQESGDNSTSNVQRSDDSSTSISRGTGDETLRNIIPDEKKGDDGRTGNIPTSKTTKNEDTPIPPTEKGKGAEPPPAEPVEGKIPGEGEEEHTKMANAINDAFIEGKFGVEALDKIIGKLEDTDLKSIYANVKDRIKRGVLDVKKVRERLITTKQGNEQDQAALLYDLAELKGKESNLIDAINKEADPKKVKELQQQLLDTQNEMMDNGLANRNLGRSASTIFRLRQLWVNKEADLSEMTEQYKASKGVKELSPEQEKEVKAAYDAIRELKVKKDNLKAELDKALEENAKLIVENERLEKLKGQAQKQSKADRGKKSEESIKKSQERIQKAKDNLRRLGGGNLSSGVNPQVAIELGKIAAEKVYQGIVKINELVRNVYEDIKDVFPTWTEEDVRAHLFPKANAEQYYKARTELEKSTKDLKPKIEEYRKLQKEYAVKMFEWQKDRRMDVMKDRPFKDRLMDGILRWQRFAVLSYPSTIAKLISVVAQQVVLKPLKFGIQKGISALTPESIKSKQTIWGNPTAKALGKYYSALIRNFSLANLKEQFSGIDTKEIMYGDKFMYDEWGAAKGLLEMPGRSHGYIKSFIKNPEFQFAHEQITTAYIDKMMKIESELKNDKLSADEKEKLENEYKQYDVTNEDVMEKINSLSLEHGKWAILMNSNKFVEKFQKWTKDTGVAGFVVKSELPIVKVPTNYVGRYFATKYGLIRSITGKGRWEGGEGNFPGIAELVIKGTKDLKPEQADLLGRSLALGTMGASFFVLGYLLKNKIKHNDDDDSYEIGGVRVSKTFIHSPEVESILSGAAVAHEQEKGSSFLKSMVDSDIDMVKHSPFISMLQYGALPRVAQALFMKDKDKAAKQMEDAVYKKVIDMVVPGAVKQLAGAMDTKDGFSINQKPQKRWPDKDGFDRFVQHLEMVTPGLRNKVPLTGQNSFSKEDQKDPTFKYFLDKGMNLPNTSLRSEEVKDEKTHTVKKISEYPKEVQDKYSKLHKEYLKQELSDIRDNGTVYVNSYGEVSLNIPDDAEFEEVEIDKLSKIQLAEVLHIAQSKATKKTKDEVFYDK
jgi:regulator of replication initiation timing